MALTLFMHPLASYCWKALIALYESEVPFEAKLVDLSDEHARNAFFKVWPIGKFPVLLATHEAETDSVIPESSIIIEYLAQRFPKAESLLPKDAETARKIRQADRFYDLYLHEPMQRVIADRLRPAEAKDPYGVALAKAQIEKSYEILEQELRSRETESWAVGDAFTMADCAAAPALYYAHRVVPLTSEQSALQAYLKRLEARPSFARVLEEAAPYFAMFPG